MFVIDRNAMPSLNQTLLSNSSFSINPFLGLQQNPLKEKALPKIGIGMTIFF